MTQASSSPFPPGVEEIGFIARIVAFCARHKYATLALALAVVLAAGLYAAQNFAISTNLDKLISPDLPWRQREIALGAAFPQREDLLLAVIDAPSAERANLAARDLESALKSQNALFASARSQ